jgi:FAD/FMN-containing dehydrogenase
MRSSARLVALNREGGTMSTTGSTSAMRVLGETLTGDVVLPDDDGWAGACQAWNLAAALRPVAVVYPESAEDMVAIVTFAGEHDLRVAFVAGGHNAGPIDWTNDALLVKTERMRQIEIDPPARRARVGAGVLAKPLAEAAGEHGLAFLAGTSPDAGIAGYVLGGGFSWMIRKYGLACNSVLAVEAVTADGRLVRADASSEPDLFWALRGGSGNFAAVTAIELALHPVPELYAGCMFWPIERAAEILNAWLAWTDSAPVDCHSIGRMLQFPDAPFLPPHLNARSFVLVEAAYIGSQEDGEALLAPLRALEPEFDTFDVMPSASLSLVNMDPDFPVPYAGDGALLSSLGPETIDRLVESFVGSSLLHAEVRHLGGAVAVGSPDHGALDRIEQPFIFFTFGLAFDPEMHAGVEEHAGQVFAAIAPWNSGKRYMNFTEVRADTRTMFSEEAHERLLAVKAAYDPSGRFLANHPILALE